MWKLLLGPVQLKVTDLGLLPPPWLRFACTEVTDLGLISWKLLADAWSYRSHLLGPALVEVAGSVTIDLQNKIFHDKTRFNQYLATNPALHKVLERKFPPKEVSYIHKLNEICRHMYGSKSIILSEVTRPRRTNILCTYS